MQISHSCWNSLPVVLRGNSSRTQAAGKEEQGSFLTGHSSPAATVPTTP